MEVLKNIGRNYSGANDLNFLCRENNIFIMDNHLAAGWSWLQILDVTQQYDLLHIDRHYDLLTSQTDWWIAALTEQQVDLAQLSIDEFVALRYQNANLPINDPLQIFRWDNYIPILNRLYPTLFGSCRFATHKDGDKRDIVEIYESEPWDLQENLSYWIHESDQQRWIVNLDIDYFFTSYNGEHYLRLFDDEYVIRIAKEIKRSLSRIAVLTIALSPETSGGWDNSLAVLKLIAGVLELEIPEI